MNRRPQSVPLAEWPVLDQEFWRKGLERGELFEADGVGVDWAPATLSNVELGYGQWLSFLTAQGRLDPAASPHERLTEDNLKSYVESLTFRLATTSRWAYLVWLARALTAMDPNFDATRIRTVAQRLRRHARPSRDERDRLAAPSEVYFAGLRRMERLKPTALSNPTIAAEFGDGLMLALGASKAVRRKNHVGTIVGVNLVVNPEDNYRLRYSAAEMKSRRESDADLPGTLTPDIDFWLTEVRPFLLNGRESTRLWITSGGNDMSAGTFYRRFCKTTKEELDRRINPHLMRKIIMTGIAVAAPELIAIVGTLLDQTSDQSEAYNLADRLTASKKLVEMLAAHRIARAQPRKP